MMAPIPAALWSSGRESLQRGVQVQLRRLPRGARLYRAGRSSALKYCRRLLPRRRYLVVPDRVQTGLVQSAGLAEPLVPILPSPFTAQQHLRSYYRYVDHSATVQQRYMSNSQSTEACRVP